MSERVVGGDIVAAFLESCNVRTVFGVVSIHNLPILDALMRRRRIRCVPARGEAGATNMADAYARVVRGLGVVVTSTGTGSGNACGAMIEAQTAGTPLLHLTGQIEVPYLDRDRAYVHEAKDQLTMLRAVSKRAYRVWSIEALLGTLREAVALALTAPMGPISVEIPIDVQSALTAMPPAEEFIPLTPSRVSQDSQSIEAIARDLVSAKRPILWAGGGTRYASAAIRDLAELGFAVVTSTQGRGVLPEDHPMSLGSYTASPALEAFYQTSDAMLVVGSRLRGSETLRFNLRLPDTIYQIDADPTARDKNFATRRFAVGDAREAVRTLVDLLRGKMQVDKSFAVDVRETREAAEEALRSMLGPYEPLVHALRDMLDPDSIWVRDITISNSLWGNRYLPLHESNSGVHAMGGGIGQGLPMAIGAAIAVGPGRKTIALSGDGGLQLCLGELATLAEEAPNVILIVMNDGGYGVIRNIQDDKFGGRHYLTDLKTPDLQVIASALGLRSTRVRDAVGFSEALNKFGASPGPSIIEVDMVAIGAYAATFAGPPVREAAPV